MILVLKLRHSYFTNYFAYFVSLFIYSDIIYIFIINVSITIEIKVLCKYIEMNLLNYC